MIRVGDKVKVVSLTITDIKNTNLEESDIGVVTSIGANPLVDFGDDFKCNPKCGDLYGESYAMFYTQLEVVEESEEGINHAVLKNIEKQIDKLDVTVKELRALLSQLGGK